MQKYSDVVLDGSGNAVVGAAVVVTTYPDGLPATFYAAVGGSAVSSVITDSTGRFTFYAANGHYSLTVTGSGITTPVTYNDVLLYDPADDPSKIVNVKSFGAIGDGVTDDTAAIQKAIDYAIYTANPAIGRVFLPSGSYKTSDTIHCGYGVSGFRSITLEGEGGSFDGEVVFGGTRILPTFSDRPAINFQGMRRARLRRIAVVGLNNSFVKNNNLGAVNATVDDTDVSAWVDPSLNANATSRYTPYAAVTVDAYSGAAPATAYPAVTYPAFLGTVAQYNKNFSSNVVIEDCWLSGFVVGVAIQPGNSDGNGDFVSFRDTAIFYCVYGVSVGNSQSRLVNFYNGSITNCHTALTNNKHGKQIGKFGGVVSGTALESVIQLFDINTGFCGPMLFEGCYGELVWRLGNTNTSATLSNPFQFSACEFNLSTHPAIRGVPKLLVEGGGNAIRMRGGVLTLPSIGAYAGTMLFDGTLVSSADISGASTAGRLLAQRSSGGVLPLGSLIVADESTELRTNASTSGQQLSLPKNTTPGGRTKTLGRLVQSIQWREVASSVAPVFCSRLVGNANRASAPLTISGISGSIDFTSAAQAYGNVRAGDLVQDDQTGTVFLCTSYTGLVASVTALNNYYNPGSGNVLRTAVPGTGNWYILSGRQYATTYPLYGDTTSGSAVIANIGRGDGYAGFASTDLAVGDYLQQTSWMAGLFPTGATISAIDTTAKTITMSANATATATKQPFHFWVQA